MKIRILSGTDVEIAFPMPRAIEAMKHAFSQLANGDVVMPLRSHISTRKGITLLMPAYLKQEEALGLKIVSIYNQNLALGLPAVNAMMLVIDSTTGVPQALMDGTNLTAIRTGAAGGLAADLLARTETPIVALFGAGVQARAQLQGVLAVRQVEQVNLVTRTAESAQKLIDEVATWPNAPTVKIGQKPQQAVEEADIVITATNSPVPVFDGNHLKPGVHVTAVGSFLPQTREVDTTTVRRARVFADSRDACLAEAGDIIIPKAHIEAELGEIVNGTKLGRQSDEEITFFKSVGVAIQDIVAATVILTEAKNKDLGIVADL